MAATLPSVTNKSTITSLNCDVMALIVVGRDGRQMSTGRRGLNFTLFHLTPGVIPLSSRNPSYPVVATKTGEAPLKLRITPSLVDAHRQCCVPNDSKGNYEEQDPY